MKWLLTVLKTMDDLLKIILAGILCLASLGVLVLLFKVVL